MDVMSLVMAYGADLGSILCGFTVLVTAYVWLRQHLSSRRRAVPTDSNPGDSEADAGGDG